jgi:hypothetical protein
MRIGPWLAAGLLLGVGSTPLAGATVLYPEETAAMREAWVRATSSDRQPKGERGAAGGPPVPCPTFHKYTRGVLPH